MSRWVRHQCHFQPRRASSPHTTRPRKLKRSPWRSHRDGNLRIPRSLYRSFQVQGWISLPFQDSSVGIYDSLLSTSPTRSLQSIISNSRDSHDCHRSIYPNVASNTNVGNHRKATRTTAICLPCCVRAVKVSLLPCAACDQKGSFRDVMLSHLQRRAVGRRAAPHLAINYMEDVMLQLIDTRRP
ncbi:hypothetical protein BC826DRAFT_1023406 [Russula brevipes]|nr:hypothetical protein BC826DRAFT_1023406 [Russula brevipes]